ncbi:SP-RING-type domain-containing protein [Abeliophyllum distichum]|uniref:SP-RING-type domain-containing protein n=1 Tax=Abeliophyllum distichum TaxID=126358 RepID=A0ABD1UJ10_9LAMI
MGSLQFPVIGARQQQFSRSHSNQLKVSQMALSSVPQYPGIQPLTQPSSTYQGPGSTFGKYEPQDVSSNPNVNFSQPQVHQRGPHRGIGQSTGASGSHQALNNSLGSIQSSMQTNVNFSQPQVHQRGSQSGIGQATGAIGSHQAMNSTLGSIQSTMPPNANFLQPQVHQRGTQSGTGQGTGATGNHQAMKRSLGSIQSSLQLNADLSQPQVHQRGPQSGTDRATGAIGSQQDRLTIAAQKNVNAQATRPLETSRMMPISERAAHRRMRGALSGQAYSDALNQFIIQPTQQAQAARLVNVTAPSSSIQTPIQAPMANRTAQDPGASNYSSVGPVTRSGDSGVSPWDYLR